MDELEESKIDIQEQIAKSKLTSQNLSKSKRKKYLFTILGIACVIVACIFYCIFRTNLTKSSRVVNLKPISQTPKIVLTPTVSPDPYVTNKTLIASSLDVPPLYSGLKWTERKSQNAGLNKVFSYDGNVTITFDNGNYYFSKGTVYNADVDGYYQANLAKEN